MSSLVLGLTRPLLTDASFNMAASDPASRSKAKLAALVWEGPDAEFLFADLPEPGEAMRLFDQEEDDEHTD